jgi:hypothetical protein
MTLSVVVTIVDGGAALARCLTALAIQEDSPTLDVLVPYDASVPGIDALTARFPQFRFLRMGRVETGSAIGGPRGQHELFDRRRSFGLAAATGELVAILEDRGVPAPDWAAAMVRLHSGLPHAVIGGAVENGVDRFLNWAVFFCDFSRYQRPFAPSPVGWVTDVNVAYKRRAIESTAPLWRERYHEPVVHGALLKAGETLYLSPEPGVTEFRELGGLSALLAERYHWGRLFGYTRVATSSLPVRLGYFFAAPLIPLVVFFRLARLQAGKGHLLRFVRSAPAVALLLAAWSVGEAAGYLTGRP